MIIDYLLFLALILPLGQSLRSLATLKRPQALIKVSSQSSLRADVAVAQTRESSLSPRLSPRRADIAAVEAGLCESRSKAKRLIQNGMLMKRDKHSVTRPAEMVLSTDLVLAPGAAQLSRFVSRAGDKLEALLSSHLGQMPGIADSVPGARVLDVGASTGGFTDCLLQRGASQLVCVDVGHGQLHPTVAADPRVENFEGLNARCLTFHDLGMEEEANSPLFDLVVMDLSFISLTLVLPNLWKFVEPNGGVVLALVKPQFEQLERSAALRRGKGVVLDDDLRRAALDRVVALVRPPQAPSNDDLTTRGGRSTVDNELEIGESSEKNCSLSSQSLAGNVKFAEGKTATPAGLLPGAEVVGAIESPVPGGDGNREWLLVLRRHAPGSREPRI